MLSVSAADLAKEHGDRYFAAQCVRQLFATAMHERASSADDAAQQLRAALGNGPSFRLPQLEQALHTFSLSVSRFEMYSVLMQHWSPHVGGVPMDEFLIEVLSERPRTAPAQVGLCQQTPSEPHERPESAPAQTPSKDTPRVQSTDLSHLTGSMAELRTAAPPAPYATWSPDFLGTPQREIKAAGVSSPDGFCLPGASATSRAAGFSPVPSISAAETIVSGALRASAKHAALNRHWNSPPGFPPHASPSPITPIAITDVSADNAHSAARTQRATSVRSHAPATPPPYATLSEIELRAVRESIPKCGDFSPATELEPAGQRPAAPDVDESLLPFAASWMGPRPTSRRGCMRPMSASIVQRDGSYTSC
jgi:hypothetical protein